MRRLRGREHEKHWREARDAPSLISNRSTWSLLMPVCSSSCAQTNVSLSQGAPFARTHLRDGVRRADAHDARRQAADGARHVLAEDADVELARHAAAHQDHTRSTVRDLRGVATRRVGGRPLRKGRLDLCQALGRAAAADAVVGRDRLVHARLALLANARQRDDLAVEHARCLSSGSTLVAARGELVHLLARDAEVTCGTCEQVKLAGLQRYTPATFSDVQPIGMRQSPASTLAFVSSGEKDSCSRSCCDMASAPTARPQLISPACRNSQQAADERMW